jgi:hypothetical protein
MLCPDESNGVGIKGVDGQSQSKSLDLLPELNQRGCRAVDEVEGGDARDVGGRGERRRTWALC